VRVGVYIPDNSYAQIAFTSATVSRATSQVGDHCLIGNSLLTRSLNTGIRCFWKSPNYY